MKDRLGFLTFDGMEWPVYILAMRTIFGRKEVQVRPQGGTGTGWVAAGRVREVSHAA